jgi:hypothetical protein
MLQLGCGAGRSSVVVIFWAEVDCGGWTALCFGMMRFWEGNENEKDGRQDSLRLYDYCSAEWIDIFLVGELSRARCGAMTRERKGGKDPLLERELASTDAFFVDKTRGTQEAHAIHRVN